MILFIYRCLWLLFIISLQSPTTKAKPNNGLAPEVTDLNAKDVSYRLEQNLAYLSEAFISSSPEKKKDGLPVGSLEEEGGDKNLVLAYARKLALPTTNSKSGKTDSLLIAYKKKLVFESYYRRGRANYPHYQMSITKSYTAMALGRAMQLGYLSMQDLNKPIVSFLKKIDSSKLAKGTEKISLHEAMHMCSGIRLSKEKIHQLSKKPDLLLGQRQAQAYLQFSEAIVPYPRKFKYQAADPTLTMQALQSVIPGKAKDFIRDELLKPMQITNYHWQEDISGLPKSAAGSSFLSRDMVKMGLLVLENGKWKGKQHIPEAFVKKATSPIKLSYGNSFYGYFWWIEKFEVDGIAYPCIQGRGAGGQFIFLFPTLELVAVTTAHNKGMGTMLRTLPQKLIPAFTKS